MPPVFRTSTFLFKTAEEGKRAFEIAFGLSPMKESESPALIYTRVNNPNTEILEEKAKCWDRAEDAALFGSGMGAVSSTCLAFLRPDDTLIFADPVYGGTDYFFRHMLPLFGIKTRHFPAGATKAEMEAMVKCDPRIQRSWEFGWRNQDRVFDFSHTLIINTEGRRPLAAFPGLAKALGIDPCLASMPSVWPGFPSAPLLGDTP